MAGRHPSFIWHLAIAAGAAMLAGCDGPLSILDPASPDAASVARLWWVMLAGAAFILTLVMVLVLLAFTPAGRRLALPGRFWLIGGGLVFPVVTLFVLLVYAFATGERLLAHAGRPDVLRVEAVARQWYWTFTYPDAPGGARSAVGVLQIPADRPVDVHVTSEDVIHSFWVPRLAGKIDAIPGHVNVIRLLAPEPGTYSAHCAEFCGLGHTGMAFTVEVLPAERFAAPQDRPVGPAEAGGRQ